MATTRLPTACLASPIGGSARPVAMAVHWHRGPMDHPARLHGRPPLGLGTTGVARASQWRSSLACGGIFCSMTGRSPPGPINQPFQASTRLHHTLLSRLAAWGGSPLVRPQAAPDRHGARSPRPSRHRVAVPGCLTKRSSASALTGRGACDSHQDAAWQGSTRMTRASPQSRPARLTHPLPPDHEPDTRPADAADPALDGLLRTRAFRTPVRAQAQNRLRIGAPVHCDPSPARFEANTPRLRPRIWCHFIAAGGVIPGGRHGVWSEWSLPTSALEHRGHR